MQTLQQAEAQNRYGQCCGKRNERGDEVGERAIESLEGIALEGSMREFAFGEIDTRWQLALRSRAIATIAVLTALGNAQPQLKAQIHHALNVGCTRTQIVEAILQVGSYIGFAAISHSTTTAREVFQERDARGNELNHA